MYGFAGMRDEDGRLSFRPRLPRKWRRVSFTLSVRRQVLNVSAERESTTYCLRRGTGLDIEHQGRRILLEVGHRLRSNERRAIDWQKQKRSTSAPR